MGKFNDAVSTLLEAFSSGIAVIRSLRRRRKESNAEVGSAVKAEESRLSKSLKKNRADVWSAYTRDLEKLGHRFSEGDVKAHSSLTSILFRLNAGFVSIIDRFTKGESTQTDYRTLVNLSNASRIEAIKTFEQLSARLSQSSVALSTGKPKRKAHGRSKGKKAASSGKDLVSRPGGARSKSSPQLSLRQTALGPATSQGWVRPKGEKIVPTIATGSKSLQKRLEAHGHSGTQGAAQQPSPSASMSRDLVRSSLSPTRPNNRMSMMSFASDSTKIGEIPERRSARPAVFGSNDQDYLANTVFPLTPWEKPRKPRSRFMRLFRK